MHPGFVVRSGFLDAASQLLSQAVQSNRGFGQHLAKSPARLVQLQFQSVDGIRGVVQLFQLCAMGGRIIGGRFNRSLNINLGLTNMRGRMQLLRLVYKD